MPIKRIRGVGSVGVIKDLPPFEIPSEAWSDAKNVRFAGNRIEKVSGYFPVLTEEMPDEIPLAITGRNNTRSQIYGTPTSLYLVEGTQHRNVSKLIDPNLPDTDPLNRYVYDARPESTWYYTTLSNAVVMNTKEEVPQGLAPYDSSFSDIPGWGYPQGTQDAEGNPLPQVDWRCGRIRAFRNYLVALDMTEQGVDIPQRVRWSNVAYINSLPPDWQENDENKDGGFNDLSDANGRVVDGVPLRDSFVIYTDKETYLMEYVGGIFVFQFKKLFSDVGLLAPECAAEFEQKHFVISKDDIFVHNGSTREPVASSRVKKYLIEEISSVNPLATKVFAYTPAKEIWITYVGPGSTAKDIDDVTSPWVCNKCAVWNWEYNTWSFFDIPPSMDVNLVAAPNLLAREWSDYDDPTEDYWDAAKWAYFQWNTLGKDFVKNIPYIASTDKCLYTMDIGNRFAKFNPVDRTIVRKDIIAELKRYHLDLDDAVEDTRTHKLVTSIIPQIRGSGQLRWQVGGSENATRDPTWDGFTVFDVENDVKVDAFSNNRYPAIRITDYSPGEWSMTGYDIEFVTEGIR